ncbi:hypothetical protein S887_003791 [Salmonella enterica subsp. diarizonae]|nr:hypothetical protein [Salmonella enterica subsp. diarizonae]
MNNAKKNIAKILLLLSLSPGISALANTQKNNNPTDEQWWIPYKNSQAFNETLDQFGLTYHQLEASPEKALSRSADVNDVLFWQKRTMAIYANAKEGIYHIPVTEQHDNGRSRTTTNGRTPAFFTYYYANVNDTMTLRTENQPDDVKCYSLLENNYSEPQAVDAVMLNHNSETKITFNHKGVVLLQCWGTSEDASLKHVNTLISTRVISTTASTQPVFVLGVNTLDDWKNISQQSTPSGQTLLFDGRTRYYAANNVGKASKDHNIEQTLREHLLNTIVYDKLNGIDGSSPINEALRSLDIASYNSCCWAEGGDGRIGIGFGSSIPTQSSWGEWHEFGHQNQMQWSWNGLGETTVNIYSIAACRATRGEVDVKTCHENLQYNGFQWDQQAVGNFLKSGQTWDLDTDTNVFHQLMMFAQLESSWPDLYPALGKAYREINNYYNGSAKVDSKQEKVDFFVVNASKYSGHDLRKFFTHWGVDYSTDADNQITAMNLPQVIEPSGTVSATLEKRADQTQVEAYATIKNADTHYNTGFVTNTSTIGPTSLVWNGGLYQSTPLYVQVVDTKNRNFIVKLYGQRTAGYCEPYTLNTAGACNSGSDTTVTIRYDSSNNQDLPAGEYHGVLHLIARDWHNDNWSENVNFNIHINN